MDKFKQGDKVISNWEGDRSYHKTGVIISPSCSNCTVDFGPGFDGWREYSDKTGDVVTGKWGVPVEFLEKVAVFNEGDRIVIINVRPGTSYVAGIHTGEQGVIITIDCEDNRYGVRLDKDIDSNNYVYWWLLEDEMQVLSSTSHPDFPYLPDLNLNTMDKCHSVDDVLKHLVSHMVDMSYSTTPMTWACIYGLPVIHVNPGTIGLPRTVVVLYHNQLGEVV